MADIPTISLAEAKRRDRRKAGNSLAHPDPENCPVTALGHVDGKFWFLTIKGEQRGLTASAMARRSEIAALFLGDVDWLLKNFPDKNLADFCVAATSDFLMRTCGERGLYGSHVAVRRVGVWRGEGLNPVANCGDAVFVGGERRKIGTMIDGQIFVACPAERHPAAKPAGVQIAQEICAELAELWSFRDQGGEIMAMGLVGAGYLAAALDWRPNGFLTGPSNAGKSHLLEALHALAPLSHYSTDTTKAGIESAVNGRAMPIFLDEASDREGTSQNLLDVVLSASSGAGTKLHRGTADGVGRSIEVCASVIMASVSPPAMLPQHRSRFVLIELLKPEAGADHRAEMADLTRRCGKASPALFARALRSLPLYQAALKQFRAALGRAGCVAREMDQLGAVLAGWWYLVEDETPNDAQASSTVRAIANFIRGAETMGEEDAPAAVLNIFLSRLISGERTTEQASVANLLALAISTETELDRSRRMAVAALGRVGLKAVREIDQMPRGLPGNGLWINPNFEGLKSFFVNTLYSGDRWRNEMTRHPCVTRNYKSVRIADMPPARCLWLNLDNLGIQPSVTQ